MKQSYYIIDVKDYRGFRVVLTKKKWQEKSIKHPELRNKKFLKNIKEAIKNPNQVWQDYSDKKNKRCYYKKYSVMFYIKVVIWMNKPCRVVTAFEIDRIKEEQYTGLKRLK
tara:strand:+ start:940 stop:1272 length:333 start_codon:yes stop_codon:yes gene_type:complete